MRTVSFKQNLLLNVLLLSEEVQVCVQSEAVEVTDHTPRRYSHLYSLLLTHQFAKVCWSQQVAAAACSLTLLLWLHNVLTAAGTQADPFPSSLTPCSVFPSRLFLGRTLTIQHLSPPVQRTGSGFGPDRGPSLL